MIKVVGLRGGHSPYALGSIGLRNEYLCMQELYKCVELAFTLRGIKVINCNSNGRTEAEELREGTNIANQNNVDLFISLHMNAFDGTAHGTEVIVANGSTIKDLATNVCKNISHLGWKNRGVKYRNDLYECKYVKAPNMVIELCFCDSQKDINIFSPIPYEEMAKQIVNGILGQADNNQEGLYKVQVGAFKEKKNAENLANELTNKGYKPFIVYIKGGQ